MLELSFGTSTSLKVFSFPRTYDAYSTFYLNSSGLICRHHLDKVSPGTAWGWCEGYNIYILFPTFCYLFSLQLMPSHSPPTPVKKLLVGALVTLGLSAEPEPNLHVCSKAWSRNSDEGSTEDCYAQKEMEAAKNLQSQLPPLVSLLSSFPSHAV
jgi:hypothetical protein